MIKLHFTPPQRNPERPADGHLISSPLDMKTMALDATAGADPKYAAGIDHTATDWMKNGLPDETPLSTPTKDEGG
ncbi:hypothetical protein [Mesorhizobium wenxiniae]|uniref:Uncharacterized protein n=1 Tax=Mesorhizobium wenxiniae TaxID=2014805 RepID=A0A271K884_9HYPH|nr:hypothetical protein [Mesorhizobium wenxiniae]PAP91397.1 hypothetical protein CIT31_32495 [Mesorhizobium wenxiniae]